MKLKDKKMLVYQVKVPTREKVLERWSHTDIAKNYSLISEKIDFSFQNNCFPSTVKIYWEKQSFWNTNFVFFRRGKRESTRSCRPFYLLTLVQFIDAWGDYTVIFRAQYKQPVSKQKTTYKNRMSHGLKYLKYQNSQDIFLVWKQKPSSYRDRSPASTQLSTAQPSAPLQIYGWIIWQTTLLTTFWDQAQEQSATVRRWGQTHTKQTNAVDCFCINIEIAGVVWFKTAVFAENKVSLNLMIQL